MKVCLACGARHEDEGWNCPSCGSTPARWEGFLAFAPDLQAAAPHYKPEYHAELATLESRHFWFRARNALIAWAFRKHFGDARDFLEIGCGTGFVLAGLSEAFPGLRLSGSEIFVSGLAQAARRVPGAELLQMDARTLPFESAFDVVGAFDVIEHIQEDGKALAQMHQALRPGGGLLLTVPQHPFLWSGVDAYAGHQRRYRRRDLVKLLEETGFEVLMARSFVSLLLPLMAVSRWLARRPPEGEAAPELAINPALNRAFGAVQSLELGLIRLGVSFPAGGSLLVAAKRREGSA